MVMTSEEKFLALKALDPGAFICVRQQGDWYCHVNAEISSKSLLTSPRSSGRTPLEAVDDMWSRYMNLKPDEHIVINAYTDKRRAVKWNGFMWSDVNES